MDKIKTLGELAKENPDKTYNELTRIQEDARLKKEGVCITAALKKDIEGPTVFDEERKKFKKEIDYHRYWKDMYEKEHKLRQEAEGELTILKGIETNRVKEAQDALANALEVNESHQKLNGKLQERLTELEEENKKMHDHINKKIDAVRKSGM